jgi:serine/threonine protein kinase
LAPGARLGPFEVTAQIGAGGMGEVWRAVDTNLGRHVAIKILPDTFAHDAERLARFERAVDVSTAPKLTLSRPRVLFEQRYVFGGQTVAN